LAFWLFVRAASLIAQATADPSGHWEGAVQLGDTPLVFEVDVTRGGKGELSATFAQPSTGIKGFPFSKVEIDGRTLRLVLKAGANPSSFVGTVSEDGKTVAGDVEQADQKTTFTLTRTGDARVAAVPKNGRISKHLEGTWKGALDVEGKPMRLILTLANVPDGTATGTVLSPDGSGIEIPVGITESESAITIDVPSVGAAFQGAINADKTELAGKWAQSGVALPLTLRRGAPQQD
jgi:hypothetical protein